MQVVEQGRHFEAEDSATYERGAINGEIEMGSHTGRLIAIYPFDDGTTSMAIGIEHPTLGRQAFEVATTLPVPPQLIGMEVSMTVGDYLHSDTYTRSLVCLESETDAGTVILMAKPYAIAKNLLALQRYSRFAADPCRDRFAAAFRRWW